MSHHVTRCKKCERVVAQCRCMSPNKTTRWVEQCDICKRTETLNNLQELGTL